MFNHVRWKKEGSHYGCQPLWRSHAHLHLASLRRKSDKRKLEPDDDEEKPPIKKDADSDDGASDQEGHGKDKDDTGEMGLVREIRYKLEMLNFKVSWGEILVIFQEKEKGNGNNQSMFSTDHFSEEQLCPERAQSQRSKSDLGVRPCAPAKVQ